MGRMRLLGTIGAAICAATLLAAACGSDSAESNLSDEEIARLRNACASAPYRESYTELCERWADDVAVADPDPPETDPPADGTSDNVPGQPLSTLEVERILEAETGEDYYPLPGHGSPVVHVQSKDLGIFDVEAIVVDLDAPNSANNLSAVVDSLDVGEMRARPVPSGSSCGVRIRSNLNTVVRRLGLSCEPSSELVAVARALNNGPN